MPGLYLHIPFCKQACHYCNFHFSTSLTHKEQMIDAICQEIQLQSNYLQDKQLNSIYFGGGTPSLLTAHDLEKIFEVISKHFQILKGAEITLEANPDDLDKAKINALRSMPINRLSIGIQSFFDEDLQWMNRAHAAKEAHDALSQCKAAGFENITIDLIYGSPTTTDEIWEKNLDLFREYELPHLSSYALTVEDGTALGNWVANKKVAPLEESKAARQFELLQLKTKSWGMDQYEISNFGYPDNYAIHNTNYWQGIPYLGIGPAAHSFDGRSRQWNISHNAKYMKAIAAGEVPAEREVLSPADQFNEYIMTALRTQWGISIEKLKSFGPVFAAHFEREVVSSIEEEKIILLGSNYCLATEHRFFADGIAANLFFDED